MDSEVHFPGLEVSYLLEGECVVGVEEAQPVSTGFQLGEPVLAMPVLVAAETRLSVRFKKDYISKVLLRFG